MANDSLETYRRKRDFKRTSEPAGGTLSRIGNLFVIHKHDATRLHYDLRLQIGQRDGNALPRSGRRAVRPDAAVREPVFSRSLGRERTRFDNAIRRRA